MQVLYPFKSVSEEAVRRAAVVRLVLDIGGDSSLYCRREAVADGGRRSR